MLRSISFLNGTVFPPFLDYIYLFFYFIFFIRSSMYSFCYRITRGQTPAMWQVLLNEDNFI